MLRIPFTDYYSDAAEEEQFKLLSELVIHNKGWGYTCFVSAFAVFVSDRETKTHKSLALKALSGINTVEKFKALGLPIRQVID